MKSTEANPITPIRQSAKQMRAPEVLTREEVQGLLSELRDPWKTAVYVGVITGLRVSELLGRKWADADFKVGELRLSRGVVRHRIGAKGGEQPESASR